MSEPGSNAERMRAFVDEVQLKGQVELIDEFVHPEFRNHTVSADQGTDREGVAMATSALHAAFSDLRIEVLHCFGDGDLVSTHKVFRGTHTGDWFGAPPSGNPVEFSVMDVVRYRDGRMFEHWAVADSLTLLQQTGALG